MVPTEFKHARRVAAAALLAVCSVLIFSAGCSRTTAAGPPNVLLVVVDTLRKDHLEPFGYTDHPTSPFLQSFAAECVAVDGFTSVSPWTKPSMATLLTGLPPAKHGVSVIPDNLSEPLTLARALGDAGYDTACVQSNLLMRRRFLGKRTGFDEGFAFFDDEICEREEPHRGSTAPEVTQKGLSWLQGRESDQPWFMMLQYYDPHVAYENHDRYAFEDAAYEGWVQPGMPRKGLANNQANCAGRDRQQLVAYYDEEVRAVDDALAHLVEQLRARPDWKNTLVVFTADHGEELGERGYIGHTISLHHELIDLPLLVRLPGGERGGLTLEAHLPERALFSTILDLCGQPAIEGRGESFAPMLRGDLFPQSRPCFSEVHYWPMTEARSDKTTHMRSVIANNKKLVRNLKDGELALFDLIADPDEQRNLLDAENGEPPEAMRQTATRLSALMARREWLVPGS